MVLFVLLVASQSPLIGAFVPGTVQCQKGLRFITVSIPSDRGIRSGSSSRWRIGSENRKSQSPLIGAFVPGMGPWVRPVHRMGSQSPLIGAFVPGIDAANALGVTKESQSPLIGAFVPGE